MSYYTNSGDFIFFLAWFLAPLVVLYFLAALAGRRRRGMMFWIAAILFTVLTTLAWDSESFEYAMNLKPANKLDPSDVFPFIIPLGWVALAGAFFLAKLLRPWRPAAGSRPSPRGFEVIPHDKGE